MIFIKALQIWKKTLGGQIDDWHYLLNIVHLNSHINLNEEFSKSPHFCGKMSSAHLNQTCFIISVIKADRNFFQHRIWPNCNMNFTYKFKRITWRNTVLTISSRLGKTGTVQSVSDPPPTVLLYQLLCPVLHSTQTVLNRCVACNVCSPVLFASHVFFMKPNGSPNPPLHDCLACAEPDRGERVGGGRRERCRISWAHWTEAMIWGKGMNIRAERYHPRMDNILWLDSMTLALMNTMKP